jgi:hypothetical protein
MIVAGFLSTMNFWVASADHVRFHLNDVYMVLLMVGWMVLLHTAIHYQHMDNALQILVGSILFNVLIYYLIRTQTFVSDSQYLKGMIPHHSMAILMSEKIRNKTNNPQIQVLANNIIDSQQKEIEIMNNLYLQLRK